MGNSSCLRCEVEGRAGPGCAGKSESGPASPEFLPVTKILSWPCLSKETWHSFLKLDNPVLVQRLRSCRHQLWMGFQDPFEYRLLVVLEIYAQDMFIVLYSLFKAGKVVIGCLDTKQSTLPRAKTEYQYGKEDERYPADRGIRPAGKIGDSNNQHGSANTDRGADQRRVDNVFLHKRLDPVEMLVVIQLVVVRSEHMDLRGRYTGTL